MSTASEERIAALERMLAADPNDWLGHYLLGVEYMHGKRFDDAAERFRRCLALKDDYTAAWKQYGDALRHGERPEEALAAYRRGVEVAEHTGDLQVKKECEVFIRKLSAA